MSPYTVTTIEKHDFAQGGKSVNVSRPRAVATLEKARAAVWEAIVGGNEAMPFRTQAQDIPESGGTIELPDGTVIEVAMTSRASLWAAIPESAQQALYDSLAGSLRRAGATYDNVSLEALCDAYNARAGR